MLYSLHIENIAVIQSADVDFLEGGAHFSALTGETGAGKSLIVDSIAFLLGARLSRDVIRRGEDKATVSATFGELEDDTVSALEELGFSSEDGCVMLTRSLTSDGKSTARINGRVVTSGVLKDVSSRLVSIHGQNDSVKIMNGGVQLAMLDSFADVRDELERYGEIYSRLSSLRKEKEELLRDESEKLRMKEILEFQIKDIESARLKAGCEEALLVERNRLANIEKIQKYVDFASGVLDGGSDKRASVTYMLDRAEASVIALSAIIPDVAPMADELSDMRYRITDIAARIEEYRDGDASDPTARLDKIEGALNSISKLKRKYGSSVEEILKFKDEARAKLDAIENADERIANIDAELRVVVKEAKSVAQILSEKRMSAAKDVAERVCETLKFLDMPNVKFEIAIRPLDDFSRFGLDGVEFLIATNSGDEPAPMTKIASGGELSRIMLALKSAFPDGKSVGTLIFDEIDTGISGSTSSKVGIKLKEISRGVQVICVTHSAQIASLADLHLNVSKHDENGRTLTDVKVLDELGRVEEIARILGGIDVSETQRAAAREMIREGSAY